jgi:4-amino-4-deoxy-L-arabinose transferase-like glycosyltransferase
MVQAFSLVSSIGTLSIIYWLIKHLEFISPIEIKKQCLLLACTLPQLIMFGNYISNDSLSFLIGALIFLQVFLYINNPIGFHRNILALYLGLGLLTKGSFVFFIPALILLILLINFRNKINFRKTVISLLIFIFIFLALGSYKGIQNIIHFGKPMVLNIDKNPSWMEEQRPTYMGLKSIYDVNILKLLRNPTLSNSTRHSYPLMLYGSFWYQYIEESNFKLAKTDYKYLGSWIYILALLPTLLFFIGFLKVLYSSKDVFGHKKTDWLQLNKSTYEAISLFLLLSSLLIIVFLGAKYDVWSAFQSRYLFPCFFAIIILFNSGLGYTRRKCAIAQKIVYSLLNSLYLLFILYFSIEIGYKITHL